MKYQYYYKRVGCPAKTGNDQDCICWHDEGSGIFKDERHDDEIPHLAWREVQDKCNSAGG